MWICIRDQSSYQTLSYEDTLVVKEELAPLILPDGDEASACPGLMH